MKASSARSSRRTRAVESFASAAECIGPVEPGMALFAVTRGQFSMLDAVQHVITEVGPCEVSVWTWTIAEYEVEVFTAFLQDRRITGGTLVIDRSAEVRNAALIEEWRSRFGAERVRVCNTHAKIATVRTDARRVLLRGSMNLNFNPRFEQLDITEGGPDFDLVAEIEADLPVLRPRCSFDEADRASKTSRAFEASTLALFGGTKVWAK